MCVCVCVTNHGHEQILQQSSGCGGNSTKKKQTRDNIAQRYGKSDDGADNDVDANFQATSGTGKGAVERGRNSRDVRRDSEARLGQRR